MAHLSTRCALAALTVIAAGALTAAPAQAKPGPGGGGDASNRNGGHARGNRNYASVNSPTAVKGDQNVSISISGKTNTQIGSCRRRTRRCRITLNSRLD
ncbi:hypothetical protein [Microbispora sp. ATCC PTA-5024]|uniref:hypothetical protein n=1 Tax=Microbispora sp. ATCC PTA-5024 TaxID=316330 RepID=UPI0003DD208A|nr:hypothetical protein [Microbispora sp. ATCC PTA-5024]ETK30589.1 hypothetical protein MPTA5024_39515 [Microbispora sp. ATCC PTA-5024]